MRERYACSACPGSSFRRTHGNTQQGDARESVKVCSTGSDSHGPLLNESRSSEDSPAANASLGVATLKTKDWMNTHGRSISGLSKRLSKPLFLPHSLVIMHGKRQERAFSGVRIPLRVAFEV